MGVARSAKMAASKSVHQKAVVGRGKGRAAPPPGPLLLAAALSLTCFLVSDYLLYDETPCDGIGIEEQTFLQTHRQLLFLCSSGGAENPLSHTTHTHTYTQCGQRRMVGGFSLSLDFC